MMTGSAPGVSILIGAALEDGIGIIVLVNADSEGDPITNIFRIVAEKVFGSGDSSSSPPASQPTTASRRSDLPRHAGVTTRGDHGTLDVDLTGTYYNAGHGAGKLCSAHSSSPPCESVPDAFRFIDSSLSTNSSSTDLFASWVTILSTHMRFTYTNDNQFSISIGSIYPQGYGKNSTAFSTLAPGATADFVVENGEVVGFGLNIIDDDGDAQSGSVEETAEVWFVKT